MLKERRVLQELADALKRKNEETHRFLQQLRGTSHSKQQSQTPPADMEEKTDSSALRQNVSARGLFLAQFPFPNPLSPSKTSKEKTPAKKTTPSDTDEELRRQPRMSRRRKTPPARPRSTSRSSTIARNSYIGSLNWSNACSRLNKKRRRTWRRKSRHSIPRCRTTARRKRPRN